MPLPVGYEPTPVADSIVEMMKAYAARCKKSCKLLYLSSETEIRLAAELTRADAPRGHKIRTQVERHGIRTAVQKVFGLKTIWGADVDRVA